MKKTTKDGEWYCRTCITKPGGTEECQEESSNNYQITENDSFSNPIDGGAQGNISFLLYHIQGYQKIDNNIHNSVHIFSYFLVFGGYFGPYGSFGSDDMHRYRGKDPRSEMLKRKEESDSSLFDKFFGGR